MAAEFFCLAAPFVVGNALHLPGTTVLLLFFLIKVDFSACGAEIVVGTVEKHELAQRALDAAVEQRNFQRRLEPDVGEVIVVRPYYPCVPSLEILFEACPYSSEKFHHVVGTQSAPVRWIHHEDAIVGIFGPVRHGAACELHHIVDLCGLDVATGYRHGIRIDVAAVDPECEFTFAAVIVIEFLE